MSDKINYYVKEGVSIIVGRTVHEKGKKIPDAFVKKYPKLIEDNLTAGKIEKKFADEKPSFDATIPEDQRIEKPKEIKKMPIAELKKNDEVKKAIDKEKKKEADKKSAKTEKDKASK